MQILILRSDHYLIFRLLFTYLLFVSPSLGLILNLVCLLKNLESRVESHISRSLCPPKSETLYQNLLDHSIEGHKFRQRPDIGLLLRMNRGHSKISVPTIRINPRQLTSRSALNWSDARKGKLRSKDLLNCLNSLRM